MELFAYAYVGSAWFRAGISTRAKASGENGESYHRPNVGVRNSIELVEVQLVFRANIDVSTLVLRHIAVLGCREN